MTRFSMTNRRLRATLLAVLLGYLALPFTMARASEMPDRVSRQTVAAYRAEQQLISTYRASADIAAQLDYARLLSRGTIAGERNPLRVSDIEAAIAAYRELLASEDEATVKKVRSELADLLMRKGSPAAQREASELRANAKGPAVDGGQASVDAAALQEPAIEKALREKMAKGSLDAAFDLLMLLNRRNADEAATLRSQMLLMANVAALDGDSGVIRLSGRYAASLDAQAHPDVLKSLLALAAAGGSDSAVGVIEKNKDMLIAVIGRDEVRRLIWMLVEGGSSRAAEQIALDLVDENVYGFDEADAKWAVAMLEAAGSYRAHYLVAKLNYQGIYVDKNVALATAAMDRMLAGADEAGQDRLVVADRIARINLSDALVAKYALPIYLDIWKAGNPAVVGRIARIIVSAEKGGYYATPADMPLQPAQFVSDLAEAYAAGDLSAGLILGDIYREGRLVDDDPERARSIYENLRQQYADVPAMQRKLREQLAKLRRHELEVTHDYAGYYGEIRDLAGLQNPWAIREYGILLAKGGAQFQPDPEQGFTLLLKALSLGYFSAGPDAADLAFSTGSDEKLKRLAAVYDGFDPRILTPESNVQLAKIDFALEHYSEAGKILNTPEVLELPTARFLFAQVGLASGRLEKAQAEREMRDVILSYNGDGATLLGFIQQLISHEALAPEFAEPVLVRLADLADKRDVHAINAAFKLRQAWPASEALGFRKVVDWCGFLAERGQGGPLTRVAMTVNARAVGEDNYRYLIEVAENRLQHLPTNGNLRMFLAREYMSGRYRAKDFAKADELTRQAAELGNEAALNSIATNYYFGQDVAMDRGRAEALYRALAFMGSNRSALALARSYSKGPTTRVYESRAFAYYIKAALNGSVTAMTEMGRSYLAGAGVTQDDAKGVAWLEKAAGLGNTDAMTQLYYYHFIKNPTNNNPDAERWMNVLVAEKVPDMILRKAVLLYDRDKEGNKKEIFALLDDAEELGSQFARRLKNSFIKEARVEVSK